MANITILEAFTRSLTNTKSYIDKIAATKVDKVDGKGLSTNDLTDTLKSNYETAYAHSQAAHAPVNAQKNSDITKAEIEAKLTGQITSHTHAETYTLPAATSSTLGGIKVGKGLSITADGILNTAASGDTAHTHSNMEVLDSISSEKVAIWDAKSDFNGDYNNLTNKPITILTAAENEFIILSELAAGAYLITGLVKYMSTDTAPESFDNSFVEVTKFDSLTIVADPSYITAIDSINNSMESSPRINVQADWNAVDTADPSYINNKPTIPTVTNDLTNALKANYDAAYTHSTSTHAPSNAQKNSDILKSEIEAKLTGNITSHTHSQYLTSVPAEYITEAELNAKGYAPLDSPNFTNSISMARKSDTTIGAQSVALGYNTTASGFTSHAEGNLTTASGDISHAEGINTIASGEASHAEGSNTTASGAGSHAEGGGTTASGAMSHAEGGGTIASSENQHVQGKYNIKDTENKYAHIVGNGEYNYNTEEEVRSNAHTLDWSGNAWFAGKVSVGTAPTENMDLTTKKYVDDKIAETSSGGGEELPVVTSSATTFDVARTDIDNAITTMPALIYFDPTNDIRYTTDNTIIHVRGLCHIYIDPDGMTNYVFLNSNIAMKFDSDNYFYVRTLYTPKANILSKYNTLEYTPTTDYNPATKKYVDDAVANGGGTSSGSAADYGPYSIRYNSENNRLEFIYTPTN